MPINEDPEYQAQVKTDALNSIPLDPDVYYDWVLDVDNLRVGIITYHRVPFSEMLWCSAMHYTTPHDTPDSEPPLTVEMDAPLTITEALVCPDCGRSGHITQARWVPSP